MTQQYLTQKDVDEYGNDLLDVSQRAALNAVSPHLEYLQQQNAALQQQVARDRRRALDEKVAALVPDYRTIDANPAWHQWLLGIDLLSGRMRQQLLNEAISSGNAQQVKAVFDRFRSQGHSTGTTGSRTTSRRSSGKNFYTHDDIKRLYEAHRKGAYTNLEDAWARQEANIFAAMREGRVEQKPYLTK
jgi:hypothetical protein